MALADITIADGQSTPVNHVFTYTSTLNGRVVRVDMAQPLDQSWTLSHAHLEKVVKGVKTSSHLLRHDRSIIDADGVTQYQGNIRLMCDMPVAVYSDAIADDFAAIIRNWATSANVRAWMRGSVG